MNFAYLQIIAKTAEAKLTEIDVDSLPKPDSGEPQIKLMLNILFGIVGALCLLVITISGLRYVLSTGDPQKIAQAKDGIIYSLIGLAIVIAAQAIATFVISRAA